MQRKVQYTGLAIDHFAIRAAGLSVIEKQNFSEIKLRMSRLIRKYNRPVFSAYWETGFNLGQQVREFLCESMLCGFLQSERYITNAQKIRSDLVLNAPFSSAEAETAINGCQSVALHVRRGDYLKVQKTMQQYGLCSISYYKKSIGYVLP